MSRKITQVLDDTDMFIRDITNEKQEENSEYEELSIVVPEEITEPEQKKLKTYELANDIESGGTFLDEYFNTNKCMPPEYYPYSLNLTFASSSNTILIANEMNKYWNIPNHCHWSFIKNVIQQRKKPYRKFIKDVKANDDINLLAKYFNMTVKEMYKNLSALSKEYKESLLEELKKDQKECKITKVKKEKKDEKSNKE